MKGRKRTPTHLKLLKGNPGRRPINKSEPKATGGLPHPPRHLCQEARVEWKRVAKLLHVIGVLTTLDRAVFAVYCQAYARWVRAEVALEKMAAKEPSTQALLMKTKSGNLIQNPLVGTANKAMDVLVKAAAELGMTASSRSRIEAPSSGSQKRTHPAAEFFSI